MRCHTSSPKCKGQNLLGSNWVAGMYFPVYWLDNPNVHRFLKLGHLPNPALPKRPYRIFIWAKFSWRSLIPIVNPLQYTLCICWIPMGCTLLFGFTIILHNWFQNRPPLLVLNYWKRCDKLEFFWSINDEWSYILKVFWKNKLLVYLTLKFLYT